MILSGICISLIKQSPKNKLTHTNIFSERPSSDFNGVVHFINRKRFLETHSFCYGLVGGYCRLSDWFGSFSFQQKTNQNCGDTVP